MINNIIEKNKQAQAGDKELQGLKQLFPQCFNGEGEFDIEAFTAALPSGLKITDETNGFNWLGKNYARMLTNMDTTTVIRPDEEHNSKPENRDSQNVYISGDNLDALQHLVKSYAGQVKVIYIDPPYNTGSDGFVYNDKFTFTAEQLAHRLGMGDDITRAERILSMTKRGSASHAAWLTFMLPRLSFARDLLTKDGVIFISIDDNEQANLKLLCDEVFGEACFIGTFIQNKLNAKNDSLNVQKNHEYIYCYCKEILYYNGKELPHLFIGKQRNKKVIKEGNKYFYLSDPITTRGEGGTLSSRQNLGYTFYYNPISKDVFVKEDYDKELALTCDNEEEVYNTDLELIKKGYVAIRPPRVRGHLGAWTWEYDKAKDSDELYVKYSSKNNSYSIVKRTFVSPDDLSEIDGKLIYVRESNENSKSILEYSTNDGTTLFNETMGVSGLFNNPKNVSMLQYLIDLASNDDSIILDFFGGSSSTAHAIMQMNSEDCGNRKYILVQWQEECKPDSEACKAGYRTIDEIGMERIKRAAKKIKEENPLFAGDLGFKHFTLEEVRQDTLDKMDKFDPNAAFGDDTTLKDFGEDTVLRTWLVSDGYGLTEDAEVIDLAGYKAYAKGDHLYMIADDGDFTADSMVALMDKFNNEPFSPQHIVLFGYSFGATNRMMLQTNLRTLKDGSKSLKVDIVERY